MDAEEFIQHYGVPGMKWGRRKGSGGSPGPGYVKTKAMVTRLPGGAVKVTDKKTGKPISGQIVDAKTGERYKNSAKPAWQRPSSKETVAVKSTPPKKLSRREQRKQPKEISQDAAEFVSIKQKIKAKGVQSLTNKELETVNKRMQLQTSYNKNFPKKKNPVVDFFIDKAIADASELKINSFVGPRNPNAAVVARTIFEVGRVVRESKKKKDQGGKSND